MSTDPTINHEGMMDRRYKLAIAILLVAAAAWSIKYSSDRLKPISREEVLKRYAEENARQIAQRPPASVNKPAVIPPPNARVWRFVDGTSLNAEFVRRIENDRVILQYGEKQYASKTLDKLSPEDLAFVRKVDRERGEAAHASDTPEFKVPPLGKLPSEPPPRPRPAANDARLPDTLDSIRDSYEARFINLTADEPAEPTPLGRGTNFAAIVKELTARIKPPKFEKISEFSPKLSNNALEGFYHADGGVYALDQYFPERRCVVWNVETGRVERTWDYSRPSRPGVRMISPYGKYVAVGFEDRVIDVYDVKRGKTVKTIILDDSYAPILYLRFDWSEERLYVLTKRAEIIGVSLDNETAFARDSSEFMPEELLKDGEAFNIDLQPNKVDFMVSADERAGFKLDAEHYLSFNLSGPPRRTRNTTKEYDYRYEPIRGGNFCWAMAEIARNAAPADQSGSFEDLFIRKGDLKWNCATRGSLDRGGRLGIQFPRTDKGYLAEMVDAEYALGSFPVPLLIPLENKDTPLVSIVAPEKRRAIVWNMSNKRLSVYDLRGYISPPLWRLNVAIVQALAEKRYAFLSGLLEELSTVDKPLHGGGSQLPLESAISALTQPAPSFSIDAWERRMLEWRDFDHDAIGPRLYFARQAIIKGFAARGSAPAAFVPPDAMARFRAYGDQAEEALAPLLLRENPPAYALDLDTSVAKMVSRPLEVQMAFAEKVIESGKDRHDFHSGICHNLLPRWYGKPGDCAAYADRVAASLQGDDALIAYARLGNSVKDYYSGEEFEIATNFEPQRITRGLIAYAARTPDEARPTTDLMDWVWYSRWLDPDSETLDHRMDEETATAYQRILENYDALVERHDWTAGFGPRGFAAHEYNVFKKKLGSPPKPNESAPEKIVRNDAPLEHADPERRESLETLSVPSVRAIRPMITRRFSYMEFKVSLNDDRRE